LDVVTRSLLLVSLGSLVILVIYWFGSLVYHHATGGQLVIAPFKVVGPNAGIPDYGESLSAMLESRLAKIQRELLGDSEGANRPPGTTVNPLIISQPVKIPAEFRREVDFQVSVGGVEVGGVLAWLREHLYERRTMTFTLVERDDGAVVSANLGALVTRGDRYLWLEVSGGPDAIASSVAYALIQRKFAEQGAADLAALSLADFRLVVDSLVEVERLNRKARQKHLVDDQFAALLQPLERLHGRAPRWHALTYLIGNIAESSGNRQKAIFYYTSLQQSIEDSRTTLAVDRELDRLANDRMAELGETALRPESVQQIEFIAAAHEFARLMGLKGPDPNISFRRFDSKSQQGQWNTETRTYEVSLDHLKTPGLPQYVALTGRFMNANFERCFGGAAASDAAGQAFWNEFRYSVVDYLIHSVPEFSQVVMSIQRFPLFRVLELLESRIGKEPVKRLALEMLTRYQCDWSQNNIADLVVAIVDERGLAPTEVVARAFEDIGAVVDVDPP
jgi:hypothetical protein